MLRLIPAPLHRALYRLAHGARLAWWRIRRPHITGCSAVVRDAGGRVLLVRHSYGSGSWALPGGGVKRGEDPAATVVRELAEETGCRIEGLTELGPLDEMLSGARNRVHLFTATTRDTPRADNRELVAAQFFPVGALPGDLASQSRVRVGIWLAASQSPSAPGRG